MPRIKIGKISLYYEAHGRGETLLLIPGLNADSASWAGIIEELAEYFRVIVFDNRSSGRSDYLRQKYSIRDMAGDAIGLLDHLGIDRCHVAGHSMGGYIAQELAINYSKRVGRLVLEVTAAVSSVRNIVLFNDLFRRFKDSRDNEALIRSWTYWLFSAKTFERENYVETFIKKASKYPYLQSASGFRSQIEAIASFNASSEIRNIRAKTLVIAGGDDILIYPSESIALSSGIKDSVVEIIKNTGHCAHVENARAFIAAVVKFLNH